jgi:hypothetical protein
VGHLRQSGFTPTVHNLTDLRSIKAKYGVPDDLQACHTGDVDGYVIEGHVPADLIRRLLRERPSVVGLAVPGMPPGSPGMETPGSPAQPYQIFTFDRKGKTGVYATR